jgi:hypothetical protein
MHLALCGSMSIARVSLAAFVLAAALGASGCNACGPEQHAITTTAPNNLTLGGDFGTRQVQFVNRRLTEPPATHDDFQFLFNTLEGVTSGEGVAFTLSGTDAVTQEVVTLVLALPVALREGDDYAVGGTFNVELADPGETGFWGAHDLTQPGKADVAFAIATYTFPPVAYTTNFRAATSSGTIEVTDRSPGQLQVHVNLSFTDASGDVRSLTGDGRADNERFAALCN